MLNLMEKEERKFDTRKHLIHLFNTAFKEKRGKDNPLPFGACMRAMQGRFKFEDEETGEIIIEYPTEQSWQEQVEAMFKDEFCAKNKIFDFPYFLKQFGRFKMSDPVVEKKKLLIKCEECGKLRQPFGCCEHCGK